MKKPVFIVFIVVVAAIGGLFGIKSIVLNRPSQDPSQVILSSLDALKHGDADKATSHFITQKREGIRKILEELSRNGVAFDIAPEVREVGVENNIAQVTIHVPVAEESSEVIFKRLLSGGKITSWAAYLSMAKLGSSIAQEFSKALNLSPAELGKAQTVDVTTWHFFLVKSGDWLSGYRWEIVDANDVMGLAAGIITTRKQQEILSQLPQQINQHQLSAREQQMRDARRISDMKLIQLSLKLFFDRHNKYPARPIELEKEGDVSKLPTDPLSGKDYFYAVSEDGRTYHIGATLEDKGNITLKNDADVNSRARGFLNGFDGADPIYDLIP